MLEYLKDLAKRIREDAAKAYKSWTILFNAALAFVAFAVPQVVAFLPQLQPYLPEADYNHLMIAALVGNFVLRFKTSSRIADK